MAITCVGGYRDVRKLFAKRKSASQIYALSCRFPFVDQIGLEPMTSRL